MPELRKDPIIGRWVIIASERARRPGNFVERDERGSREIKSKCAFCNNRRQIIEPGSPSKDVSVVLSRRSVADVKKVFSRSKHGLYDVLDGFGVDEVVIETKGHVANIADLDV